MISETSRRWLGVMQDFSLMPSSTAKSQTIGSQCQRLGKVLMRLGFVMLPARIVSFMWPRFQTSSMYFTVSQKTSKLDMALAKTVIVNY